MQRLKDSRVEPYYDYSNDELSSGYVSVLAVPGRPLQNREINSISGLIYGNIKKVTDIIIQDGTILSGCNFIKDTSDPDNIKCVLEPGTIYFEGIVIPLNVPEDGMVWKYHKDPLLSEVPHGTAIVCVDIVKYAITEYDDPTLTDPAENYESYGVAGAYRLKYVATPQVLTESEFYTYAGINKNVVSIAKLNDGELIGPTKPKPISGLMRDWIAQRTYDEVGNYIARGLKVQIKSSEGLENANSSYVLHISPGKAYMNGYEYFYNNRTVITSKSAIDISQTPKENEGHKYEEGINKYKLNHNYVTRVDTVSGEMVNDSTAIAGSTVNDIPDSPVTAVEEIYIINNIGEKQIVDSSLYKVDSGRKIIWNTLSGGGRPEARQEFHIVTVKNALFYEGKDYILEDDCIKFINENRKPQAGTTFQVAYAWNICRIDLLYIDENGDIKLINGIPAEEELLEEPKAPAGSLALSAISVKPGVTPENYKIENFHVMRMPVSELKSMKTRLDNIEHDIAMSQLETSAQEKHTSRESIASLRNIFTESFNNLTKTDITHYLSACSIDVFNSQLKLPVITSVIGIRDINISDSTRTSIPSPYMLTTGINGYISADWQNYATGYTDINPFGNVRLKPELKISPESSVYYDDSYSYVKNVFIPTALFYSQKTVLNWWRKQNDNFFNNSNNDDSMSINNQKITGLRELSAPYLMADVIEISGLNYPPNTEIIVYIDDKPLDIQPRGNYEIGENTGTIFTDENGVFAGRFNLPTGLESASHIVIAETVDKKYSAFTTFDGKVELKGLKTISATSKHDQTSDATYLKKYSVNYGDPIAQSVKFTEDIFISKIDLYFQSKNPEGYVFFTIRDMENGEPSTSVIYEKMIPSSDIVVSPSLTNTPTEILFDYPIYFAANKEYCFTIGSDKPGYNIWYSKIGSNADVNTGNTVQSKNYVGTYFQGSGSGAWTSLNDTCLTFTIYRADFSTQTEYYTDAISSDIGNFSMFNISADYAKLDKTDIELYYSINAEETNMYDESTWTYIPFDEFIQVQYNSEYNKTGMNLRLKLVLKSEQSSISPMINLNSLEIILAKYDSKGNYLTRTIQL